MKKFYVLFAAILVLSVAGFGAGTANAAPPLDHSQLNASQCAGGTLVVNVTQQVLNDVDSGFHGNWAYDNYTRQIQIWSTDVATTFCVVVRYEGSFETFGSQSPGAQNVPIPAGITGTIVGGYSGTLTNATLKTYPVYATSGHIGTFDYSCQDSCNYVSMFGEYFDSYSWTYNYWGWVYRSGHGSTWINAMDVPAADSGDITQ